MSKLNPNAQKWVDALRSGKYQQARRVLRNRDAFCCLGVACDISGIGQWRGDSYIIGDYCDDKLLPSKVREWLGLRDSCGCINYKSESEATHLAYKNDHGADFAEIADLIEAHAEELGVSA